MPSEIVPSRGTPDDDPVAEALEIARVSAELEELTEEANRLSDEESELSAEQSTALVVQSGDSVAEVQGRLRNTRTLMARHMKDIEAKREELKALQEAQMARYKGRLAEAEAALQPLQKQMNRLKEGIWTLQLYAGDSEYVTQLADGEPAPADTPITVRQLVLAMDEECAVAAEEGGIDSMEIHRFDEWLTEDPAHLDQVLPEPKGVVALVPRWKPKSLPDELDARAILKFMEASEGDRQTYFLFRNGERVYRYVTDFVVGERLVPTATEFTDYFVRTDRNWTTNEIERTPLEPGTHQWERAEELADARKRHFMRVGLILQGVIDRMTVWQPLAQPVKFLELDDYDAGRINIITNGERVLTDGSETFREWQHRLMEKVRPGMRIIGGFGTYDSKDEWDIWPERSSTPQSYVPHTITERLPGGRLKFLYDRTDESVMSWEPVPDRPGYERRVWRAPKTRASCTFRTSSHLVLPFDLITVEEIDRHLRSRLDRHDYLDMFPLLKAAKRAKRAEVEQEAPFRQMLAGALAQQNGVSIEDAEAAVGDLVDWWKLANRHHRPLIAGDEDNAKAVRMIIDEHRRRVDDTRRPVRPEIVQQLRGEHPNALLVARKRDGAYVVLDAQDDGDAFVTESIYSARGGLKERKEWQLVGGRQARWTIAYQSPAFANWWTMASRADNFSGPEIEELVERMRNDEDITRRGKLIAIMFIGPAPARRHETPRLVALTIDPTESVDADHLLSKRFGDVSIRSYSVRLMRAGDGSATYKRSGSGYPNAGEWPVWEPIGRYNKDYRRVFLDEAAAQFAENARETHRALRERAAELESIARRHARAVCAQLNEREERKAYEKFLTEYADPELWEGHRKTLRLRQFHPGARDLGSLDHALELLVEAGQVLDGLTVREVMDLARSTVGYDGKLDESMADLTVGSGRPDEESDE